MVNRTYSARIGLIEITLNTRYSIDIKDFEEISAKNFTPKDDFNTANALITINHEYQHHNNSLLKNLYNKKVGITAGASTPDKVIKEAKLTMAEITNEMNFAEALEETLKPLTTGDIVKGVVIGITPTEVQVDIDGKYDGVIPFKELTNDETADIKSLVNMV